MLNMDLLETGDQLTIVNRSEEYRISKELIREIPYFEKMLSHDSSESEENKIELDFDEQTFEIILHWIELKSLYIEMYHVINLCTMADYFGLNDDLIKDCFNYFHKKISVKFLPTIIPQVTSTSKLVNSSALNAFICRHFMKIVQTTSWMLYSFETIDYICKLDLMIYSEYQVFEAIRRWVTLASYNIRKSHLKALLNSVRWCHMESYHLTEIKEDVVIKSDGFEPILCSPRDADCDCIFNRTEQEYFIAAEELEGTDLRITVLDSDFLPLVNQVVKLDVSMPLHVFHDERVSDISFDSGRKMVRVDWKQNKYRLLDFKAHVSHYFEIAKCFKPRFNITRYQGSKQHSSCQRIYGSSLLEANGKFILCRIIDGSVACWSNPKTENIKPKLFDYENSFISTISDKNIYILTKNFDFMAFNIDEGELKIFETKKIPEQVNFDDLCLTSSQVKDEVFLVDKSTKNIFSLVNHFEEWDLMGLLIGYDHSQTVEQQELIELLTFTTAFLSIDAIRPCLKRKLDSMN